MKCEKCERELAKNGVKNGVQYYYCTHCKESFSFNKPKKLNHNIYEEYIARELYLKCVKQKNEFTQTEWKINHIARLLGHRHKEIQDWVIKKIPQNVDKDEFRKYLKNREHCHDILCVLGIRSAEKPSEFLSKIITSNKRPKLEKKKWDRHFQLSELEYLRLINMSFTNRKEAIFVLGALLGCRTSEIVGVKYSDIDFDKKIIHFHRVVTFGKNFEISEKSRLVSNKKYPLTDRTIKIIAWLKEDCERHKQNLENKFNTDYSDFLCINENGYFINSITLNKDTKDIRKKCQITSKHMYIWKSKYDESINESIKEFQFKWLRYTVKQIMKKAGASDNDLKVIFGYKNWTNNESQLEIMRKAYDLLDKYIEEKSSQINNQ